MSHIFDYIRIKDNFLKKEVINSLYNFAKIKKYQQAGLVSDNKSENITDDTVRKASSSRLFLNMESRSDIHWHNFLLTHFRYSIMEYKKNFPQLVASRIMDISFLKYENTGFYDWHTDHCYQEPRTLSIVLMLNDDYDGGSLKFMCQKKQNILEVKAQKNRCIVWPSCFLFPHSVEPVSNGVRYTVISWIL